MQRDAKHPPPPPQLFFRGPPHIIQVVSTYSRNSVQLEVIYADGSYGVSKAITKNLLPTISEERGVLGVGGIPIAVLPFWQGMTTIIIALFHYNCINMNIVG